MTYQDCITWLHVHWPGWHKLSVPFNVTWNYLWTKMESADCKTFLPFGVECQVWPCKTIHVLFPPAWKHTLHDFSVPHVGIGTISRSSWWLWRNAHSDPKGLVICQNNDVLFCYMYIDSNCWHARIWMNEYYLWVSPQRQQANIGLWD